MTLYQLNVTLHVLAALFWLGGMLFLGLVGAPVLRRVEPPELRARLFHELGVRFRAVGWIAIAVLVLTGVFNLALRGMLSIEVLGSAAFWQSRYGQALAWKLGLVTLMVALAAWHDFALGPRSTKVAAGSAEAARLRRRAALTARVNALAGIVLVIVAVRLARGG
jgi:copper resistance protein D